jgi:hypothetical protein
MPVSHIIGQKRRAPFYYETLFPQFED